MTRVGLLGGTFDPIHIGHLAAADDVAWKLALDTVLFVPNRQPPHKQDQRVSRVADRVAMVQLAIAGNPRFVLSTVELEREGPSYTIDTLRHFRRRFPAGTEMFFLVGCDAVGQLHTWYEPDALLEEFGLVVMERPTGSPVDWTGAEARFPRVRDQVQVVDVAELEISGNDIRRRVAEGAPIRYYVQPSVERYIRDHSLYRQA
jgi:nicotinate-nucleotide adenylyltransferase